VALNQGRRRRAVGGPNPRQYFRVHGAEVKSTAMPNQPTGLLEFESTIDSTLLPTTQQPVALGEGPEVGDLSCGEQHVPCERHVLPPQRRRRVAPARLLTPQPWSSQTADEQRGDGGRGEDGGVQLTRMQCSSCTLHNGNTATALALNPGFIALLLARAAGLLGRRGGGAAHPI
jgi:hypothetical protein